MSDLDNMREILETEGITWEVKGPFPSKHVNFPAHTFEAFEFTFKLNGETLAVPYHQHVGNDTPSPEQVMYTVVDEAYILEDYPEFDEEMYGDRETYYTACQQSSKLRKFLGDELLDRLTYEV